MDQTATPPVQPIPSQPDVSMPQQAQPVMPVVPVPAQQPQAVTVPVGGKEHEAAPIVAVAPSHPEVVMPNEVKEVGVQVETASNQEVQLTQAQKAAGISTSGATTPPEPAYTLPMTEEKVQTVLKSPNVMDSISWLATLIGRILLQRKKNI